MTLYPNARIAEIDDAIEIYRHELTNISMARMELERRQQIAWSHLRTVLYADQPGKLSPLLKGASIYDVFRGYEDE